MKYKLKRGLSLLLSLALILQMLPITALAANPEYQVDGGVNGYMAALTADADTSDEYKTAFTAESGPEIDGVTRSEDLNGKVWADKTVSVQEDTNGNQTGAFDVTLSALGQTFSSTETTNSQVAYDVMLVLDFSGSMQEDLSKNSDTTKTEAMVNAVNAAIKSLMIDENGQATNNRVGIVAYSGSEVYKVNDSNNVYNFLPLDHYTTSDSNGNYLEYNSGSVRAIQTQSGRWNTTYYVQDSNNQDVKASKSVSGGTPTQGGIYYAGTLLSEGASSTTGVTDTTQMRIPIIILMTDGAPGYATNAYTTMAISGNGVHTYAGAAAGIYGSEDNDDEVAAYTMLTANHVKTNVASTYWSKYSAQYNEIANLTQANLVKFYTIGLGIEENSWENFMLNPGMSVSTNSKDYSTIKEIQNTLTNDSTYSQAYNYTDGYWGGSISDEALTKIFETALSGAKIAGTAVNVGESAGGRDKTTFYDTLGDGIVLGGDGTMTLTVPTCDVDETNNGFAAGATRVYTLSPYDADGTQLANAAAVEAYLKDGGTVTYKATAVAVDGQAGQLDTSNSYDKAASDELSVTLQIPAATGRQQIRAAIPSTLMAYNILSSDTDVEDKTTYSYFSSEPVRLSYVAQAASATEAGEYYAGALGRTYLTFAPSSTQNNDGAYEMPYYWNNKGQGDNLTKAAETAIAGSDEYIYKTDWTDNNLVYIYLGNNGKLELSGKDLTFTIHWDDVSNVDNVRPEGMTVNLYRIAVPSDQAGAAANKNTFNPEALTPLQDATLTVANVPATNTNIWQYVFSNLPVYGTYTDANGNTQNGYFRYWLVYDEEDVAAAGYSAALYKFDDGSINGQQLTYNSDDSSRTWFCFTPENYNLTDGTDDQNLDVILTREQDTVTYTITKKWDTDIAQIPDSIQIQMYANGQLVTDLKDGSGNAVSVDNDGAFTISNDGDWTITLTLPKNSAGGNPIQYTPVEVTAGYTVTVEYGKVTDSNGSITGYTAELTNYPDATTTSLNVTKIWNDNDDQDGKRPDSVTFKLTATVNDTALEDDALKELTGLDALTKTLDVENGESSVEWTELPKTYTAEGADPAAVTYSAVEVDEQTGDDYTVAYDAVTAPGYLFVTNRYIPETVDITISKTWADSNNQDGLRPTNGAFNGQLWKQVGENGTPEVVRSWASTTGAEMTITDLPRYENGTEIIYYVSETAVNGYTLTTDSTGTTKTSEDVTLYPVTITDSAGKIALTNTHKASLMNYTVDFTWQDEDVSLRPDTITLTLNQTVGNGNTATNSTYDITLTVDDNGTITEASNVQLPDDVALSVETNDTGVSTLTISNLAVYSDGTLITYSVGVKDSGDYSSTLTDYTLTSDSFTLNKPGTYTVTYDGNSNNAVDVPADTNQYLSGTTATIAANEPTSSGLIFAGWTLTQYSTITSQSAYDLIASTIKKSENKLTITGNVTLYAVWLVDSNNNNTPDYQETTKSLTFVWEDQNDYDGLRPATVTVTLEDETQMTVGLGNVTEIDNTWTTENSYPSETKIKSVTAPDGYTATIADNGISVTLTHVPGTTTFALEKTWVNMDQAPDDWEDVTATFVLYGNGKRLENNEQTAVYSEAAETAVTWANLDQYEDGVEITYHAYETKVTAKIDGEIKDVTNYFQVAYDLDLDSETDTYAEQVTNTFLVNAGEQQRAFTYVLEWDDNNNAAGMRPSSVTVQLTDQNGNNVGDPVTISKTENWSTTWYDLDTYQTTGGAYAEYSVTVPSVTYTKADGTDVSVDFESLYILKGSDKFDENGAYANTQIDTWKIVTLDPDTDDPDLQFSRTLSVNKEWMGDDQAIGSRPDGVTVQLLGDNALMQSLVLNESGSWVAEVTVPKYQNFEEINYSVQEANPSDLYTVTYAVDGDTITVTNTLTAPAHTITFVYENAYAADSTGAKIAENEAITVPVGGTYVFTAYAEEGYLLSGSAVLASSDSADLTVTDGNTYQVSDLTDNVTVTIRATADRRQNGGGGSGTTYYTLHYESNGGTEYNDERYAARTIASLDKVPTREGYVFTGWYADKALTEKITSINMTGSKTVYAGWRASTVPDMLNGDDHFAYVIGYTDGTVRPDANISRAEIATIFFRLLTAEVRNGNLTSANTFEDVTDGMWYNQPISTMAALGIVKGRSAEMFDPDKPITRAEFTAICARFDTGLTDGNSDFKDISGHWAEEEIERATSLGCIMGYPDGTFRPDQYITRAEAMTIINRVLCRIPEDKSDLLDGMNVWPDNDPGDWYYLAVQEATNSHEYVHKGEIYETWGELTDDPDWKRYED